MPSHARGTGFTGDLWSSCDTQRCATRSVACAVLDRPSLTAHSPYTLARCRADLQWAGLDGGGRQRWAPRRGRSPLLDIRGVYELIGILAARYVCATRTLARARPPPPRSRVWALR